MNITLPSGINVRIDARDSWILALDGPTWTSDGHYVSRRIPRKGAVETEYMHRRLLGLKKGDGICVDHIDGDTLNNTRRNLRLATHQQNIRNRKLNSNNTSGYKGVSRYKTPGKWVARIKTDTTYKSLGVFDSKEEARDAYITAARVYHGAFARLI